MDHEYDPSNRVNFKPPSTCISGATTLEVNSFTEHVMEGRAQNGAANQRVYFLLSALCLPTEVQLKNSLVTLICSVQAILKFDP
jgi:hypothetical protein